MPQFITSKYIESDYVKVYPSGFRDIAYKQSKLMTEDNITLLQNFTVSADGIYDDPRNNNNYLFRLLGYTFQTAKENFDPSPEELSELDTNEEYSITLKIKLIKVDTSLNVSDYDNYGYRLANIEDIQDLLDVDGEFQGLQMSVYEGSDVNPITLIKPGDIINGNAVDYYEYEYLIGKLVYEAGSWSFIPEYQTTNNFTADRIIEKGILGTPGGTDKTNSRKIIDIFELGSNTVKRATSDGEGNNIKASYGADLWHPEVDNKIHFNEIQLRNKEGVGIGTILTIDDVNTSHRVDTQIKNIKITDIFEPGTETETIKSQVKKATLAESSYISAHNSIIACTVDYETCTYKVDLPDFIEGVSEPCTYLLDFPSTLAGDYYKLEVHNTSTGETFTARILYFNGNPVSATNPVFGKYIAYRKPSTGILDNIWTLCIPSLTPYSGGTNVTLNGSNKSGNTAEFWAPITEGASDQILISQGSSTSNKKPIWLTSTIGLTNQPVYISAGKIQSGSYIPKLNGSNQASDTSFYAPTSIGTANQILLSSGNGAPKWSSSGKGTASNPIYLDSNGVIQQGNTIPVITLNGSSNTSPSFYSPTAVGSSGQILKSNGSGAPSWTNQSNLTSGQSNKIKATSTVSSISEGYKQIKFITNSSEATDANTLYFIVAG